MDIPKELIVDACILFSFFSQSSARKEVFKKLLDRTCKLFSPDFALTELSNNQSKIIKFANITESEFDEIFSELNDDINTIKEEKYSQFISEATKTSPHKKDIPYFALALSKEASIWSDEDAFNQQSKIKIYTTNQLDKLLN